MILHSDDIVGIVGRDNMVGKIVPLADMTAKVTALVFVLLQEVMRKSSLCLPYVAYGASFRFAMGYSCMLSEEISRPHIRVKGALSVLVYFTEMLLILFADNPLDAFRTLLEHV